MKIHCCYMTVQRQLENEKHHWTEKNGGFKDGPSNSLYHQLLLGSNYVLGLILLGLTGMNLGKARASGWSPQWQQQR